ncbi:LysM peptidoglycan-binding domain-containing protein [Shimia sagamensis]|uniref:LysM domain-containing protein n=1 Tax=Shimia sagamensis TaxID=1566352 RepID=A0ABY1PIP3_9RHOB|nr:LysM peptidoglycan-binding domain-containing protein [Shimia sagamensis]SMP35252.1 LysM domain-containing protein [Shimia sagamensis]
MSDKTSIFSGNVAWVAGVVVAMGVSVFALVSTGVLDGSDQSVDDAATTETSSPAIATPTEPAADATPEPTQETVVIPEVAEAQSEVDDTEEAEVQSAEQAAAEATSETTTPAIAPSFDVVRVDAEGNTVVAGAAAPGAMLGILLDGTEVALAPVDTAGKFAAILAIEPSDAPRVLSLVERRDDGDLSSDATVIVAPVLAVAEAVTAPDVVEEPAANDVVEPEVTQENAAPEIASTSAEEAATDNAVGEAEDTASKVSNDLQRVEGVAEKLDEGSSEVAPKPEAKEETAAVEASPKPKAPAVIVSDSEGVRVVQPAAPEESTPEVMAAVSIDSISYTDTGAVMVSGRGNPSAFVRLYLDNALAATTQINNTGLWSTQLEDVAGGLYELRADEVDESAKVLSRVVTPFKRETPETVAQARAQAETVAAAETTAKTATDSSNDTGGADTQEAVAKTEAPVATQVEVTETPAKTDSVSEAKAPAVAATIEDDAAKIETSKDAASVPAVVATTSARDTDPVETSTPEQPATTAEAEQPTGVEQAGTDTATATSVAASTETISEPDNQTEAAQPPVRIVTVQPGATLWAIARDRYGEGELYLQVFEANKDKIRDPNLIYPGQVFTVPEE